MSEKGRFLFLGTGGSAGVPMVGCRCEVCRSPAAHNRRLRSSGLIRVGGKQFLIDVGPDFREQALRYDIEHLSGILLTHPHYDHVGGLDELRALYFLQKRSLPCVLSQETFDEVKARYHYLMHAAEPGHVTCAQIDFRVLEQDFGEVVFEGISLRYVSYYQAGTKVTGFRLGDLAYVSDIRYYTEEVVRNLRGVHTLVLGALRLTQSPMHFSVDEAVAFTHKVGAKRTLLTHIGHELDCERTNALLPGDVRLSFDGLELEFNL